MPSNRPAQDREQKRAEIVMAARQLFVARGYEPTSMGEVARTAGVAANTIYWYFDDKDHLLVAVLDAVMADALHDYQSQLALPASERLLWGIERLQQLSLLVTTVHARAGVSSAVGAWHERFHVFAERGLALDLVDKDAPLPVTEAAVQMAVFVIEGLITHPLSMAQQRLICEMLVSQSTRAAIEKS